MKPPLISFNNWTNPTTKEFLRTIGPIVLIVIYIHQSTNNRRVHHQGEGGVTIILKCPRVSSLHLFLSVYLCVMGGLGSVISGLWVTGHVYVLSHTSEYSLREQR